MADLKADCLFEAGLDYEKTPHLKLYYFFIMYMI